MSNMRVFLALFLFAGTTLAMAANPAAAQDDQGAVFVMTNAASNNQIQAYDRREDGLLQYAGTFSTGGNGSGGAIDPLHSQGSLTLSADHRLLFAVNAGSGTVSSFAVRGANLFLRDTAPTGGALPASVTEARDLVYVLNSGGNGSVSGFRILGDGHLLPIKDSTRNLSGTSSSPTDVVLSPNGQFLIVTESGTNKIDVFRVFPNGTLSEPVATDSAGAVPFAAVFAGNGALIVGNASNTISSYEVGWDRSLHTITNALPTDGAATCWDVIAQYGRAVYTSNAGSSTLSGFTISRNGSLNPIGSTVVGENPSGSTNLDIAASEDGRYIYTLNAATGTIGMFAVQDSEGLVNLGEYGVLPASAGVNGIAGY
jgi:6-phosphogluconolactonase